jgi:hypothetical protein
MRRLAGCEPSHSGRAYFSFLLENVGSYSRTSFCFRVFCLNPSDGTATVTVGATLPSGCSIDPVIAIDS